MKMTHIIYNANAVGRKQCKCKHGCHIDGFIKSFIDQDDGNINVVADDTGIYSRFSGCDTVVCSAKGKQHLFQQ